MSKNIRFTLLSILIMVLLPSGPAFGDPADAFYSEGYQLESNNMYDKAIAAYSKAIALKPDYTDAYKSRALLYYITGRYDEAIADCNKLISLKPQDPWNYTNRGDAYVKKGEFDKAITDANQALILSKDIKNAIVYAPYLTRAAAYFGKKQYKLALADWVKGVPSSNQWDKFKPQVDETFQKAVSLNPDDAEIYFFWGQLRPLYDGYDKAVEAFTKAISLNPDYAEAYYERASIYRDNTGEKNDLALSDLDKAIALNPNHEWAYHLRGIIYFRKGSYDLAIADFTKFIALKSDYYGIYTLRGETYEKLGQMELAEADYNKAVTLQSKGYYKTYVDRGNFYNRQGKYDLAIADFNTALKGYPTSWEAYEGRGTAYEGKSEYEKAINDWIAALEIYPSKVDEIGPKIEKAKLTMKKGPGDYASYMSDGKTYFATHKYDEAITAFDKALALTPGDVAAQTWLAHTYKTTGKYDKAIEIAGKLIAADEYNYEAYYIRGAAYYAQNKYTEAINDWDKAHGFSYEEGDITDCPVVDEQMSRYDFKDVYIRRGDLYYSKGQYSLALADWVIVIRGDTNVQEDLKQKTKNAFDKAIAVNPKDAEAYMNWGHVCFYKNQIDKAIEAFNKAIILKPDYGDAYLGRGLAYEANIQYQKAIDDLTKAKTFGAYYYADYIESRIRSLQDKLMGVQ